MSGSDDSRRREASRRRQRGIFERPHGSGVWWVRYHDEYGREHREKVGPKGLALKVYQKRKNEIQERRFFPERIRTRDVLLADMLSDYLVRARGKLRSVRECERYARYWKDALPGRTLRQVMPGDIERYVARRIEEMAPASINRELAFLKRVFNIAIADGLAESNPVRSVKLFRENNQRVRFLADEEEPWLREAIGEEEWPKVAVAVHTGLRQAEQFHLEWEYVDFTTGLLTVPRSKHGEARRVPMNETVREILRALPSRLKSPYVFPSDAGLTPLDARNYVRRVFLPALKRARIEGLRWHDLRHTFASRLVMKGVDLKTVQELMGHKTIAMTLRYAHLSPAHQLAAVRRLDVEPTGTTTGTEAKLAKVAMAQGTEVLDSGDEKNGPPRIRTADPLIKSQLLYQLS
jgi:site-specific recombinase XerD